MLSGHLSRKTCIASLFSFFFFFCFFLFFNFIFSPVLLPKAKYNRKENIQMAIDQRSDNKTRLTLYFVR